MKTQYSTAMLHEIAEEPAIFSKILKDREKYTQAFVRLFEENDIKRIYLTGCGSPGWASMTLKFAATSLLKIDATYLSAALFNNHEGFNVSGLLSPQQMLLICPAETGRTKGPVEAARKAKALGIPVVCTTLEPEGVLAETSDVVIYKPSGKEIGLPSTKGHSTGIFIFLLCFVEAAHKLNRISAEEYARYIEALERLPGAAEKIYNESIAWFEKYMDVVMCAERYHMVAYGANYATINEVVLKFTESHRRPSMAVELEEFMHGHIRSIDKKDLILFLCAEDGPEKDRMLELYELMLQKKIGADCVMIHSSRDPFHYDKELLISAGNVEFVNTLEYLIPLQYLSYAIANQLGLDMSVSQAIYLKDAMHPSY